MTSIPVQLIAHSLICPSGNTSGAVFQAVMDKKPALRPYRPYTGNGIIAAALHREQVRMLEDQFGRNYSVFEQMGIYAAQAALDKTGVLPDAADCVFILSSTKGNIEWLERESDQRINLAFSARLIAQYFNNPNTPIVVSNACISGALAMIMGKRLLESGRYRHAVVIGADRLSDFVIAGFGSFQALSHSFCRPFDRDRDGLNLGEAAACMILSVDNNAGDASAILSGGGLSNDANHLSGPSRTGAELAAAIEDALGEARIAPEDIDMIAAHGTATRYNDEMEAKALALAHVDHAPLHSLKSHLGHTLGAAGILESVVACMAMERGVQVPSLGYACCGVPAAIRVSTEGSALQADHLLKTASGFGGCNAALVWSRIGQ